MNILTSGASVKNPAILRVSKAKLDLNAFKRDFDVGGKIKRGYRNADPEDVSRVLRGNWLLVDDATDKVVICYLQIPDDFSDLIPYLRRIKWTTSNRNDGTPSTAKTLGHLERNPVRQRDFCRMAGLANEDREAHDRILSHLERATDYYRRLNPETYARHMLEADKVLPQYRVGDSPWTSAIANLDSTLPYHMDSGNVRDSWSLMMGIKKDIEGGQLVIPEYDVALEVEDNSLSGFDGQIALHGVSPFKKLSRNALRVTVVGYTKSTMWRCLSLDEEIERAKRMRTQKEVGRYQRAQS